MSIPIPITQTINAKQGVPFAYSLSGTNISNSTNWAFLTTNAGGLITFQRASNKGPNPRLIFKPLDYGSGVTLNSNGQFTPYEIKFFTWNATGIGGDYDRMPLSPDVVKGSIYLNILPQKPVITPGQLVKVVDGEPLYKYLIKGINFTPRVDNGDYSTYPGMTWTATTLPSGLFLGQDGTISGTTTQIGYFTPTFRATNPSGTSAPVKVNIRVLPQAPKVEFYNGIFPTEPYQGVPPIEIFATQNESKFTNHSSLSPVEVTSLQLKAISKVPVTWTASKLPKGMVLSKNGLLSGKPTAYPGPVGGLTRSVATVKNSGGSLSVDINFRIVPAPLISSTVFTITEETDFNFKIVATLSPTSYTATLILNGVEKSLPTWVALNKNTGTFTGRPPFLSAGVYTFRVTVTTSDGRKSSKNISVTVRPVELSLGAGTFTGSINVAGIVQIVANLSAISVKLGDNTNRTTAFSPNLSNNGSTLFTLGRGYFIQGNPATKCPPGPGTIVNPGKMIYHAYKNTGFATSYNPGERKGILIVPGKTYGQLGFSQGLYNIVASWIPNRCSRAAGWKITYSYPLTMSVFN